MRRKELASEDTQEIHDILDEAEVGSLGVVAADGYPRVIPLNFVRVTAGSAVAFHCAQEGEKWAALEGEPKVTFNANIPYSVIPSYWLSNNQGCGATHFFKSVQINGVAKILSDRDAKADALQKLMEKYQPEGKYKTITADDPMYKKPLEGTGVLVVNPDRISCKIKFGQNLPGHTREKLINYLKERGEPIDLLTAEEIRKRL